MDALRVWRKKLVSVVFSIVLILLLVSDAYANEPAKTTKLTPEANCYVQLDLVELVTCSDNEISVRVKGHMDASETPISFLLQVDPTKKTYKTIKNQNPNLELATPADVGTTASTNRRTVRITTLDPLYIELCKTWLTLTWTYDGTSVNNSSRSKGAWDACPSPLGTDWYLIYNNYGTFYKGQTCHYTSTHAKHENWDFGFNDKGTWAYHDIWTYGYADGSFDWDISFQHTGEGAWLLMAIYDIY